jgi:hypothetical protein
LIEIKEAHATAAGSGGVAKFQIDLPQCPMIGWVTELPDLKTVRVAMASETYRAMARECYELARQTQDDVERRKLILLAAQWTELADLSEKPDHVKVH